MRVEFPKTKVWKQEYIPQDGATMVTSPLSSLNRRQLLPEHAKLSISVSGRVSREEIGSLIRIC